jgi:hypothetical protein
MMPAGKRTFNFLERLLLGLTLLAIGAYCAFDPGLPHPLGADAPPNQFSGERAFAHVQAIAKEPHPIGSAANDKVRQYIDARLNALGLTVKTQSFTFRRRDGQEVHGVNLMTEIPGTVPGAKAVTLVCHYDSVPIGPGASDDGAGVATLLETARALKSGPTLSNSILFVFTDGEEAGLKGAQAFVEFSPQLKEIGVVLNFEARGVSGPVFMFETSDGNGELIRELARAAPRPRANSLMYEVYRHMPNDTDLTVFKKAGLPGLNFGFIGEAQHYHTRTDDPAHLSKSSLQHEGSYALSLTRELGGADLSKLKRKDAVYFDLFGRVLVHYPGAFALPSAAVGAALFLLTVILVVKDRRASPAQLAGGAALWATISLVIALLGRGIVPHLGLKGFPEGPLWCAVFMTIALSIACVLLLRRWLLIEACIAGAFFWWVLLAVGSAASVPGASFLFIWPLLCALLGWLLVNWLSTTRLRWAVLALSSLPALILVTPLVRNFYTALGPDALFLPLIVCVLEFGVLSPQFQAIMSLDK